MKQLLLASAVLGFSAAHALPPSKSGDSWNFEATLDGKPIGTHRFVESGPPEAQSIESQAHFTVRIFGIPVYRYSHQAREHWQGECLRELDSDTNDNGTRQHVAQRFEDDCLMGFAYWNPHLVNQHRLVNPQTGKIEEARFEAVPDGTIAVDGHGVSAHGWRLVAGDQRIVVWYASDSGRWIGLDAQAKGGRQLAYRLLPQERQP